MCIICIDLEKERLTVQEAWRNLGEMKNSIEPDHYEELKDEISKLNFKETRNVLVSNVTGKEISNSNELKDLLIKQIESRVRWRESVLLMINKGVGQFIEIGPGKVLSGLIKRINRNIKVSAINTYEDIKLININE